MKDRYAREVERQDLEWAKQAFSKLNLEGEKPTKYFCNLEKQVRKMTLLYSRHPTNSTNEDIKSQIRNLKEFEYNNLEKEIYKNAVSKFLKETRNNVAPGMSGFTDTFYKVFRKMLSTLATRAINRIHEQEFL